MTNIRVMAVDPGQATGWVVGTFERFSRPGIPNVEIIASGIEWDMNEDFHAAALFDLFVAHKPHALVFEDFVLHADRTGINLRQRNILSPVRITAKLEILVYQRMQKGYKLHISKQSAADAKKMWSNDKLRNHGVYRSGKADHERDAIRHLMLWATKFSNQDKFREAVTAAAWPTRASVVLSKLSGT